MKTKAPCSDCTVLFLCLNFDMHEHQKILNRIEKLIEQLPYKFVKIEIELKGQTLVLEKESRSRIGFRHEEETK